ncbi:MAG TPA: hypothetical protein VI913_01200 [Candidatus Peribacteraceae bacterium]|nr:hypothetical protein [Candidatus Peribacteraceae bacterium]
MKTLNDWLELSREINAGVDLFGATGEFMQELNAKRQPIGDELRKKFGESLQPILQIADDDQRSQALSEVELPEELQEPARELKVWYHSHLAKVTD